MEAHFKDICKNQDLKRRQKKKIESKMKWILRMQFIQCKGLDALSMGNEGTRHEMLVTKLQHEWKASYVLIQLFYRLLSTAIKAVQTKWRILRGRRKSLEFLSNG